MLRVLREAKIPIDVVAGTSVGALIGVGYCAGTSLEDMERVASETKFTDFGRWTPSWLPMRSQLDDYRCRHGLGYSVIGVGGQVCARCEKLVVEIDVKMLPLKVHQHVHGRHGAGQLSEGLIDVERLDGDDFLNAVRWQRGGAHLRCIRPRPLRIGVKRSAGTVLSRNQLVDSGRHRRHMRWAGACRTATCRRPRRLPRTPDPMIRP